MGGLIVLLLICVGIAAVPVFIFIFSGVRQSSEGERPSPSQPPTSPIVTSLSQAKVQEGETIPTESQPASGYEAPPKGKSSSGSFIRFLLIALALPAVGLATLMVGVSAFLLAMMMSIVAFGYGGFFDFASATIELGKGILLVGFWWALVVCAVFLVVKLISVLE